jgi:uroporphyrinogen decarboxylase
VEYYVAVNQRIFAAAADAIEIFFVGNDFGSQNGPLLSPAQFERFMLPHIKRLIDLGHAHHLKVQLHCCGGSEPLIPAMIAAGLDALHAIQPCCRGTDLRLLKTGFDGQFPFNGAIDSHHVLIKGDPRTVREKTREVLETLMPGGGYVAGPVTIRSWKKRRSRTSWQCSMPWLSSGSIRRVPEVTHNPWPQQPDFCLNMFRSNE